MTEMTTNENKGEIILFQTDDGQTRLEVQLQNETVWLTIDQMAELFQRHRTTILKHIKNVFEEGELEANVVCANFAHTTKHGAIEGKEQMREIPFYNLDMIISVGYRVHSHRGVQFRMWATNVLREYLKKGVVLNDELLKRAGGGNYFDELLERIRDIRSSEKVFYRKVLEIYATSIDYDPRVETTQLFFKTVQNKIHFSAHGHTAAELIYERADAETAKNYLSSEELDLLNRIVTLYLDFAELQAKAHVPMYMKDWVQKLDDFLRLSNRDLLTHAGKISAEIARQKADAEYDKFKERAKQSLSPVEIHFIDQFEAEQKRLKIDTDRHGKDK